MTDGPAHHLMENSRDTHLDSTRIRLRDGAVVELRRLTASDYDAVIRLSETLTSRERYLRFFQVHPALLDQWARSLTEPSGDLFAMGVFEVDDLIGAGNYALTSTSGSAEIAVVVAHEQHERGVGTALLEALGKHARRRGLKRFVADVLAENHSMLKVLSDAGWPCTLHLDGSVFHVETNLQPCCNPLQPTVSDDRHTSSFSCGREEAARTTPSAL